MLRGSYWTLISVLLLLFLSVNIEGNKRREKPSRWKEAVDNDNDGRLGDRAIVGGMPLYYTLQLYYPKTFKFTYSTQYDESCECQRSVPRYVSQSDINAQLLEPPEIPHELYRQSKRKYYLQALSLKDRAFIKPEDLRMYLIKRDERGAFMVISGGYQPICDDEFNDRTANFVCQLHGFKTGRRTSISLESRKLAFSGTGTEDAVNTTLGRRLNGIVHYDPKRHHCFRASNITHHPGQAHTNLGKDAVHTKTTLGVQMLNTTDNISIADTCSILMETHVPCSKNQAAAVFCHNNDPPFLQFYNIEIHVGLTKFYITFDARYVKLGRIYEYFEDFPKSNDVMPKRADFSATMCGRKVPLDLETTRKMGKGRHLVFLGKFLKKCEECVRVKFKDYVLIREINKDPIICKMKGDQERELEQ